MSPSSIGMVAGLRSSTLIKEREILRVVASLENGKPTHLVNSAIREVLVWAQKRNAVSFPEEAWRGDAFDCLSGGRTVHCVRLKAGSADLWATRCDDPDKNVPGRVWTTEVTVGFEPGMGIRLSVRLLVSSTEKILPISPHVPGFLRQISHLMDLKIGNFVAREKPWLISNIDDVELLADMLEKPDRLPVVVVSGDERDPDSEFFDFDQNHLARAMLGLAHIVFLPANLTYYLSDLVGRSRSVFHGAIRIYNPGFTIASDPFLHRLFLGDIVHATPDSILTEISVLLAAESLRRTRLERDVLSFGAVRSASLQIDREQRLIGGATDAERLTAEQQRADALEFELKSAREQVDQAIDLAQSEEDRAKIAESQLHAMQARIRNLEKKLELSSINPDSDLIYPDKWDGFADWCEENLVGRLALTPAARRGVRAPAFEDVQLVARCLHWLASSGRDRFLYGGGTLSNISIESGLENAPCGGDEFDIYFQGRKLSVQWHVKSGGNTRAPEKCLRIYYAFDPGTGQIIIADMPAHRHTDAT